ncbi:hypothetical protein GWI33_014155 [Rhynchophorus ferrugineus]|uniref:Uncharacterized protein n=1 Tax=Rhynchophorus ferrugineus TaxID=354439 RepID=A0A834I6Q7_RHYFE|nr:hypothetical protein GWI33_014155 [Rhynchophorus ferrugineus]
MASADPPRDPPKPCFESDIGEQVLISMLDWLRSVLSLEEMMASYVDMSEIHRMVEDIHRTLHVRRFRFCLEEIVARIPTKTSTLDREEEEKKEED